MEKHQDRVVKGQVIHQKTKKGVSKLRVEAFDKDTFTKDDYLGSAQTSEDGRFAIRFSSEHHGWWVCLASPVNWNFSGLICGGFS